MRRSPPRRKRRLAIAALLAVSLALLAWRGGILFLEHAPLAAGADPPPSCVGTLDAGAVAAVERARPHLRSLLAERRIPGLAIAVAREGRLVWSEGLGWADGERRVPACPHFQFRIQSVSKPVTAAALARLVERGIVDLDAPISTYLQDAPPAWAAITARQLASHRAGIRDYRDDLESLNTTSYPTATASLARFRDDPLVFPPGSGHRYTTYGFVLLSAVMEGAAGMAFPEIIDREVLAPLGLRHSAVERPGAGGERVAFYDHVTPYSLDGSVVPSPALDVSSKWAGGGMLASAEDLARFGTAHLIPFNRGFLADATLATLFTPLSRPAPFMGYGLGWIVGRDHRGRRVRMHFGAGSGGSAVLAVFPGSQVVIALVANLGHAGFPGDRLLAIAQPFVGDRWGWLAWAAGIAGIAGALALARRQHRPAL